MRPLWSVSADGSDISGSLAGYLGRLTVTDRGGMESDELELTVADARAELAVPRLGAVLTVALGYQSTGAVPMGAYTVDTVEIESPPRQLRIRGHAADQRAALKTRKPRAWEDSTLGAIVSDVAADHDLTPAVDADLAAVPVARIDQTNETDPNFLTRLARAHDAIATIKAGRLVFARRGQGATVSGTPIEATALTPDQVTRWRISLSEQDKYSAAEARYYDRQTATEEWVRAGSGEGDAVLRLRPTFPDRARAQAAADARLSALARGTGLLSLTLPGRPALAAETPLTLSGFGADLDGRWITTRATHTLDAGGYRVDVEAERAGARGA